MTLLHIAHTEASLGWGGQEIRILTESAGMLARGHRVTLLCPPEARIFEEARRRNIPVVALPIGKKSPKGVFALRRWLKEHRVDVVNTHSSTDSWLAALARATLPSPPPLVRTRHISAPIPNNLATRWMYLKATRHIVTTGEKLRRQLMADNAYPPSHITSVPTGIDTHLFVPGDKQQARQTLNLPAEPVIVGIVATLRSWKGHLYLLEAFSRLHDSGLRLLIVGEGPRRQAIEQRIGELGLSGRVILAGNQRDVAPWLQAMDIFVLPSYANEGVPQAILQAGASALPVISTPVGSITEVVEDEKTGLLVEPRNANALENALSRLLKDAGLRERLGHAALEKVRRDFGIEAMLDRMESIFQQAARPDAGA